MKKKFEVFQLKKVQAPHFVMSPIELKDYIDFDVQRVYYITKPTGGTTQHCHKVEKEMFIMVQGTATAVIDQGKGIEEILLQSPTSAFYCANYVWHGFKDFSADAVLLALSSTNYRPDRGDYIEDYTEYLKVRDEHLAE